MPLKLVFEAAAYVKLYRQQMQVQFSDKSKEQGLKHVTKLMVMAVMLTMIRMLMTMPWLMTSDNSLEVVPPRHISNLISALHTDL